MRDHGIVSYCTIKVRDKEKFLLAFPWWLLFRPRASSNFLPILHEKFLIINTNKRILLLFPSLCARYLRVRGKDTFLNQYFLFPHPTSTSASLLNINGNAWRYKIGLHLIHISLSSILLFFSIFVHLTSPSPSLLSSSACFFFLSFSNDIRTWKGQTIMVARVN